MSLLFTVGRVLFSVLFIVSGTQKLMNIPGTAEYVASHVTIPAALGDLAAQAESLSGMKVPELIAIGTGVVEVVFGLLLAFGIVVRLAAFMLALVAIFATLYFHDFWNQADPDRTLNMIQAEKNLSIFGGLLILFALGSWRAAGKTVDDYYPQPRQDGAPREPVPPA